MIAEHEGREKVASPLLPIALAIAPLNDVHDIDLGKTIHLIYNNIILINVPILCEVRPTTLSCCIAHISTFIIST